MYPKTWVSFFQGHPVFFYLLHAHRRPLAMQMHPVSRIQDTSRHHFENLVAVGDRTRLPTVAACVKGAL